MKFKIFFSFIAISLTLLAGCGKKEKTEDQSFIPLDLHFAETTEKGPAYTLEQVILVNDEGALEKYLKEQAKTLREYEAEIVITGAKAEILKGEFPLGTDNILIKWPNLRTYQDYYNSEDNRELMKIRRKAAFFNVILFDGSSLREQLAAINRDSVYVNPAIVIYQIKQIGDMMKFVDYVNGHIPSMEKYGGKYLAEVDKDYIISGDFPEAHYSVLQAWPSKEAFINWSESEEFKPWKEIRDKNLDLNMVVLAVP